jgi:dTDP-4-dehydrorhamnose 3,5-epimerase
MYNSLVWKYEFLAGDFEPVSEITGVGFFKTRNLWDSRGYFRKIFSVQDGIELGMREIFWSVSYPGVVRGIHSGIAKRQGDKFVTVQSGKVFDCLVDLRPGSTLGKTFTVELNVHTPSLYVPAGVAHGYQVVSDSDATGRYATSTSYIPKFDSGVHPLTCGVVWPLPISSISQRDLHLPSLDCVVATGGWALSTNV